MRVFVMCWQLVQSVCKLKFQLKKEQKTAFKSMLMYRNVLAVLPTGYGKSLAFQAYVMARGQLNKQRHKRFHLRTPSHSFARHNTDDTFLMRRLKQIFCCDATG